MKKFRLLFLLHIVLSSIVIAQFENTISKEEKLYGLSKIWMEVTYNFAFFHHVPDLNWDSTYKAFIPKVLETKNDWEYYLELQKFMALLKDAHTRLFPPVTLRKKYYGTATKQILTRLIEGKVIITKVISDALRQQGLKEGMEMVAINNLNVFEYVEKNVAPFVYASTIQDLQLQKYGHFLLNGNVTEPVQIDVQDFRGKIKTYNINREPWILEEQFFTGKQWDFEILDNNIGYLKMYNFISSKQLQTKFDSLYKIILTTDGLIIDVRNNSGGSTQIAHYILRHFTQKPFKSVNWRTPNNISANRSWGKKIEWLNAEGNFVYPHTDKKLYMNPLIVLADESTFSAAEDFCVAFLTMERGKLIGRKTAGSTGSPLIINLPGEAFASICTKEDFFPNGRKFVGMGISPDIEVKTTINDIIENKDAALEVAIKEIMNE